LLLYMANPDVAVYVPAYRAPIPQLLGVETETPLLQLIEDPILPGERRTRMPD